MSKSYVITFVRPGEAEHRRQAVSGASRVEALLAWQRANPPLVSLTIEDSWFPAWLFNLLEGH